MKVCVLNISGNVGKSTLAVHLFNAFNPKSKIISVESHNASITSEVESIDVSEMKGSQFKDIYKEIMMEDSVIVDVGSSNVVDFMSEASKFKSSIGEFDKIVVPTVPADKQQKDTISTINWLHLNGFPKEKIQIVFNQYDIGKQEAIEAVYSQVIGYLLSDGKNQATYEPYAIVMENDIFEIIKPLGKTISELSRDKTDWLAERKKAKKDKNMDALELAIDSQIAYDLAQTAHANLEEVYKIIVGEK